MFWGIILKSNKKYTQVVKKSFLLSNIALDVHSCKDDGKVELKVTISDTEFILCNLQKGKTEMAKFNLKFEIGELISFSVLGDGKVHLSGTLLKNKDGEFDSDSEEEFKLDLPTKDKSKSTSMPSLGNEGTDDENDDEEELDFTDNEEEIHKPLSKKIKLDKKQKLNQSLSPKKKDKKHKQKDNFEKSSSEKTLYGVKIQDIQEGTGPEAKSGDKIGVCYQGRIAGTNEVFDETKNGEKYKFRLGKGKVIKGWDIGLVGMKVGGKRKITVPPHLAYGNKGLPPKVPKKSTCIFEVVLKSIKQV